MNYLFKFLKCLIWPVIFSLGVVVFATILSSFIDKDSNLFIIINALVTCIFFIPLFIFKTKDYKLKYDFKSIKYIPLISIFLALFLNTLIILFNRIFHIENVINSNILIMILSSGIVGPILEEYLFRGIVFNELKEFNSTNKSIILGSIIFGLFHNSFTQIIYAFLISYFLLRIYE